MFWIASKFGSWAVGLVLGTLYPAYASYKAVRTKNVREYVKWMMYWIVFAFFSVFESIAEIFVAFWFPFYYELKIVFLLWLISPVSRGSLGSSMLYRKLIHPQLLKREDEIDRCLGKVKNAGYDMVYSFATRWFEYATNLIMTAAVKGGGGLVHTLKKSYSLTDLADVDDADYDRQRALQDQNPRQRQRAIGFNDSYEQMRDRSDSRGGMSRSSSRDYAPYGDVPYYGDNYEDVPRQRVPHSRSGSEIYKSPSTEPYHETTHVARVPASRSSPQRQTRPSPPSAPTTPLTPNVKEPLLPQSQSSQSLYAKKRQRSLRSLQRPRSIALEGPHNLSEEGDCRDLPRVKSMATLSSKSSPKKRGTLSGGATTIYDKNRDARYNAAAANPKNQRKTRKFSKSSVNLMSKSLDSESKEFRDFEFSEDYLMSLSSESSEGDYAP